MVVAFPGMSLTVFHRDPVFNCHYNN